jgi:hypothetical protein
LLELKALLMTFEPASLTKKLAKKLGPRSRRHHPPQLESGVIASRQMLESLLKVLLAI